MGSQFDYLAIGHVSQDIVSTSEQGTVYDLGGTVAFSGRVAVALGCKTALLTSAGADFDVADRLASCTVHVVPAEKTTVFENIYTANGRQQIVHACAGWIGVKQIPAEWKQTPIVHLGPITNCVDPQLVHAFDKECLIGVTPQGWMRSWDESGIVRPIPMQHKEIILPAADAVVIGEEDLVDAEELSALRRMARLLVMTRSAKGCLIFQGDSVYNVPAPQVEEINPTGAGDIFATALFVHLWRTAGNIIKAAEYANRVASLSVAQPDLKSKIEVIRGAVAGP